VSLTKKSAIKAYYSLLQLELNHVRSEGVYSIFSILFIRTFHAASLYLGNGMEDLVRYKLLIESYIWAFDLNKKWITLSDHEHQICSLLSVAAAYWRWERIVRNI